MIVFTAVRLLILSLKIGGTFGVRCIWVADASDNISMRSLVKTYWDSKTSAHSFRIADYGWKDIQDFWGPRGCEGP